MDISKIIAENLKRLRTERNLSLGQLSELCNVSKVMLSQIEKGDTNPTINTLWKIAIGLKVPYTSLLDQQDRNTCVIKKNDTEIQSVDNGNYRVYCYYSNTATRNFELFQIELDEGCTYTSIGHSEKSQEYIMIIEGELSLTVKGENFTLSANDTINFFASEEHSYCNSGYGTLRAAIINYYPT